MRRRKQRNYVRRQRQRRRGKDTFGLLKVDQSADASLSISLRTEDDYTEYHPHVGDRTKASH